MSDETALPPQIKISWYSGVLAAFLIFVLIGIYSARMTRTYTDYDQQRAADRYATLKKVQDDARKTLTTADWVDQGKGIVRIPIDEAMVLEIETLKGEPAQIGAEIPVIAPAAPAPVTTTAAGATNAASAKPPTAGSTNAASATPPAAATPPAKPNP